MSVQVCQYLIYAVRIKKPETLWDEYEQYMTATPYEKDIKQPNGIFCLDDGMNGQYTFVGRMIKKSMDDFPFLAENEPLELPPNLLDEEKNKIIETVNKEFKLNKTIEDFKFYLVTHYS